MEIVSAKNGVVVGRKSQCPNGARPNQLGVKHRRTNRHVENRARFVRRECRGGTHGVTCNLRRRAGSDKYPALPRCDRALQRQGIASKCDCT